MKIAVLGCGAVGSYYGARLCHAGRDVHFLLRSDYDHVRRHGVWIRSPGGDLRVRPKCAQHPEQIGPADLVLIALKTTANDQFRILLPPLVGPQTALLTLQNGLGNEEALAELYPPKQILGGLCFVCLNRVQPGVIHHIDHGRIVIGEFGRWPEPRTHDLASMFRHAGVPCKVADNLARAHWEKLIWNIPFNGLGVASCAGYEALTSDTSTPLQRRQRCLTTDLLLADPRWEKTVRALMEEILQVAQHLDLALDQSAIEKNIERTKTMGAYRPSTLLDFEAGRPLELEALFQRPLREAGRVGVKVPLLATLCRALGELDPGSAQAAPAPVRASTTDQDSNQDAQS